MKKNTTPRSSICVFSPRNNSLVQYFDNSGVSGNKNGTKETLQQNQKSKYKDNYQNLLKVKNFDCVITHTENVKKRYDEHRQYIEAKFWTDYFNLINGDTTNIPKYQNLKELGTMSISQVKSTRKCVENLLAMIQLTQKKNVSIKKQKFATFVTLTLPSVQKHSDTILRKCLTRFIENLTKSHNVQHYVWKAEAQQNGNIHFHLVIDMWVDWQLIRKLWNKQIDKLGYIEPYRQMRKERGFVYTPYYKKKNKIIKNSRTKDEQYQVYLKEKSDNFSNPNTTDIHALENVTNSVNYILKYLTKLEPTKRPIIGAVWGCANITKKLEYPRFYETEIPFDQLNELSNSKTVKCVLKDDYFSVYSGKIYSIIRERYSQTWKAMKEHYKLLLTYTKETYKQFEDDFNTFKESLKQKIIEPLQELVEPLKRPKLFQYDIYNNLSPVTNFKFENNNLKPISSFLSYKRKKLRL